MNTNTGIVGCWDLSASRERESEGLADISKAIQAKCTLVMPYLGCVFGASSGATGIIDTCCVGISL